MLISVFKYIDELDCFTVDDGYKQLAQKLGLSEWNEVVWIGRFFALDNDYGEHWFDNWEYRDLIADKAKQFGIEYDDLLIVNPERFKNNKDGPCHTDIERKRFWIDVLKSLKFSLETIVAESRKLNEERRLYDKEDYITDLEDRIQQIKNSYT